MRESELAPRRRDPIPALTGIRFFAAFYVVLFHGLPWLKARFRLPVPLLTFLGNGYLAVALFFLLSGFILAYTYDAQIENSANRLRFWEARFARIYPVYFLSLLLAYPFERNLSLGTRLSVLCMVQAWNPKVPGLAGAWNYPAWSLSVEAFFYLTLPFVLPWISRLPSGKLHGIASVFLLACVAGRTPVRGLGTWDQSFALAPFIPLPVFRLPEFLLGVTLGITFLRSERREANPVLTTLAILSALVLLSMPIGSWVSLVLLPFSFLVYDLAQGGGAVAGFLSTRMMVLLGGASYSIYLLQFPVRSWVRLAFSYTPSGVSRLGSPLTPVILVGLSILVFKFWEEPLRRKLRPRNQQSKTMSQDHG